MADRQQDIGVISVEDGPVSQEPACILRRAETPAFGDLHAGDRPLELASFWHGLAPFINWWVAQDSNLYRSA